MGRNLVLALESFELMVLVWCEEVNNMGVNI